MERFQKHLVPIHLLVGVREARMKHEDNSTCYLER